MRPTTLVALLAGLCVACGADVPARPHVILVVIDTLRADHLELYGHEHVTAPFLAELAAEGVLYERVVASSSWTKTSMASLFTARDPDRHGVRGVADRLPRRLPTLATCFQDAGYLTLGVNTNPWLEQRFGFDAGFESYDTKAFENGRRTSRRALDRLVALDGRPLFLFVHFMDVHAPYTASLDLPPLVLPEEGAVEDAALERRYRKQGLDGPEVDERVHLLYDEGIRSVDRALRRLVAGLEQRGLLDGAVLAVTADHGESFREHGTTEHGRNLYPEVTRVPLLLWAPGRLPAGLRVPDLVSTVDLAPTLLELAGIEPPPEIDGRALAPGGERAAGRVARAAVGLNDTLPDEDWIAVVSPDYLYLRERRSERVELYDLRTDPGARTDLGPLHPAAAFHASQEGGASADRPEAAELDDQLREDLRALGYLDDG